MEEINMTNKLIQFNDSHKFSAVLITWWKTEQKDIILSTPGESQDRRSKEHALIIWVCYDKQHPSQVQLQRNTTFCLSPQCIVDRQARAEDERKHNHNPFYQIHQLHLQLHAYTRSCMALCRVWMVHEKNGLNPIPNFMPTISADPEFESIHWSTYAKCLNICKPLFNSKILTKCMLPVN